MNVTTTSLEIYRLDVYRLVSMALSHKKIAGIDELKILNDLFFENETFRLLVILATMSRQILENDKEQNHLSNIGKECGYEYKNLENKFCFRDMCNKIIHAKKYKFEDYFYVEEQEEERDITVIIKVKSRNDNKEDECIVLLLREFSESCIMLIDEVNKKRI